MENDFSIEEILDMPVMGEVQMNQKNTNCVGHNDLCKVVFPNNSETPKQDIEIYKTGDYKEPDYIEADNESHGGEIPCELFCVTGNDPDYIDIGDLY